MFKFRKAFTLVEVAIIVVILGILAALIVPRFMDSDQISIKTTIGNMRTPQVNDFVITTVKKPGITHKLSDGTYLVISNSDNKLILQSARGIEFVFDRSAMNIESFASDLEVISRLDSTHKSTKVNYESEVAKYNCKPSP
jgi:competence protein ComGC